MTQTANLPARQQQNGGGGAMVSLKDPVRSQSTLKALLEASRHQIAEVLPEHVTPERIIKVALVAAVNNPALLNCSRESVLQSVMQAATLGLDPGGPLGSAYLVPYGNKCTLIPGYRGFIDLARRSGEIVSINAEVVYKADKFVYRKGVAPVLEHEPALFDELRDEDIVGAYMIAHLKGGGLHIEFMNRGQIEKVRRSSKSGGSGPWRDHFPEMCRKTVVRRGFKYLPVSSERLAAALEHDNRVDGLADAEQQSGSARLNARHAQRPPSEGLTIEQDPDAADAIEAEASEPAVDIAGTEAEPDVSGADDQPPSPLDQINAALAGPWGDVKTLMLDKAKDNGTARQVAGAGIDRFVLSMGKKGREDEIEAATRFALYEAIVENRFDYAKGVITP